MRKKIIGMCICMLVLATVVPAVTSVKNNAITSLISNPSAASMAGIWTEEQKLLTSDGAYGDDFGWSISLDGDTALIGADQNDDNGIASGSAYVFTRSDGTWTQQALLLPSDGAVGDRFGYAVALSGDTAFIGANQDDDNGNDSGSVYIFTRSGTTWTQQQKLLADDGAPGDDFGVSISLSGDTALIGANWNDDNGELSGSAYVFTRSTDIWTQQALLLPSDGAEDDRFGYAVALSGDTALIGAWNDKDNGDASGSAYMFTRTGTTWTQQQKLLAEDGTAGDNFGIGVDLDGDTALISAYLDDDNGKDSGSVYVFTHTGTTWTQQAKLLASDGYLGDYFGGFWQGMCLDGDTALIGAYSDDDNGSFSGSAYVFTRSGTTWTQQQKLLASDGAGNDFFGNIVALDGNTAFIAATSDDNENGGNAGSVYVFTKVGLTVSIAGGIGVSLEIKNDGLIDTNNVPWWIHVEGGILGLINQTLNGTINITAGETISVGKIMLFGFGPITITAKVTDEEQTATGFQIIVFSMVKK